MILHFDVYHDDERVANVVLSRDEVDAMQKAIKGVLSNNKRIDDEHIVVRMLLLDPETSEYSSVEWNVVAIDGNNYKIEREVKGLV